MTRCAVAARVSVVIAVLNGEAFVAGAISSALRQTHFDLEVLVVDNGSTDGTWAIIERFAAADRRVRPLQAAAQRGPDVARNCGIEAASGEWIAILDADDVMHPRRLERLLRFAGAREASVVADNQRLIDADGRFLRLAWRPGQLPARIDAPAFVRGNLFGAPGIALGYLKPMFRRDLVRSAGLRYQPRPRKVEDYQFMYSLLRSGADLHVYDEALYDYALLPNSLSRQLEHQDFVDILAATQAHLRDAPQSSELARALGLRLTSIENGLTHMRIVDAVKRGGWLAALAAIGRRPRALAYVARYLAESLGKRLPSAGRAGHWREAPATVAFFAQDRTDSAVIRRIAAFQHAGAGVIGFSFRRRKFNRDHLPDWDNVDLGETVDRHYLRRLWKLAAALAVLARHRRRLAEIQIFYARNLDMALLACFARLISHSKAPLAYEVLDIQRALLGRGPAARLLRWAERRVLAAARILVVSSPAFLSEYFLPRQGYAGPCFQLENKILAAQLRAQPDPACDASAELAAVRRGRLVIGWFGTLRCAESLTLLTAIAARLPERVLVYLRGLPTETGLAAFLERVGGLPNIVYGGEYFSPRDLPSLYGAVDLAWCFDFLDRGANSDWLLPNRLYDAGFHNVPVLAAADTECGRRVAELGLGWTFRAPFRDSLLAFLGSVSAGDLAARRSALAALPRHLFAEEDETRQLIMATLAPAPAACRPPGADPLSRVNRRSDDAIRPGVSAA